MEGLQSSDPLLPWSLAALAWGPFGSISMKIHFFRMETPAGSCALWTDAHKTFELTSRTRPNSLGYQFFHSLTLDGF